jgi:glycine hydroxymethyltransferase
VLTKESNAKALDKTVFPGMQGGPLEHIIAGKAVCFLEALQPEFKTYAKQIVANAKTLAETLTAGGVKLASGGTDNHLMLADVTPLGLTGSIAEKSLDKAGITVNKNMIPFDTRKAMDPSGIRIGTPALTTRGMKEAEMKRVGEWILKVLRAPEDATVIDHVRGEIKDFCKSFPVPGIKA